MILFANVIFLISNEQQWPSKQGCFPHLVLYVNFFRWMSDEMVDSLTPSVIGKYPNTYTFTKGLAEHVVTTEREGMPLTILRPSIIAGSYTEPFPVSN